MVCVIILIKVVITRGAAVWSVKQKLSVITSDGLPSSQVWAGTDAACNWVNQLEDASPRWPATDYLLVESYVVDRQTQMICSFWFSISCQLINRATDERLSRTYKILLRVPDLHPSLMVLLVLSETSSPSWFACMSNSASLDLFESGWQKWVPTLQASNQVISPKTHVDKKWAICGDILHIGMGKGGRGGVVQWWRVWL